MTFDWDEDKRRTNIRDHGIDFADCPEVFEGYTATIEDKRHYGEQRFKTLGLLHGRLISIIHTEREEAIRFISARKASTNEQAFFNETLGN